MISPNGADGAGVAGGVAMVKLDVTQNDPDDGGWVLPGYLL